MQSAFCMLHASGKYTGHSDAFMCSLGSRGRAYTRRCQHRVVQGLYPWFTLFEITRGPHWDQCMCWTEQGWKSFLVDTLRQLELTKILEFCLFKDASSGMRRKEEKEDSAAQQQKEVDRQAKIWAALFSYETR
eukprot:4000078-Pyramimonas_sp.AAC.1